LNISGKVIKSLAASCRFPCAKPHDLFAQTGGSIARAKLVSVMASFFSSGELEAFEFDVVSTEVSEVVVGLLGQPGFGAAAEDLG